jgi:hypothetical protein
MLRSREMRNQKRLRRAAIAFAYGHYVAYAHPPGRVHRAVPGLRARELGSKLAHAAEIINPMPNNDIARGQQTHA